MHLSLSITLNLSVQWDPTDSTNVTKDFSSMHPLQRSCLENPGAEGAWWAAVYGVAQSWTLLKRLSSNSSSNSSSKGYIRISWATCLNWNLCSQWSVTLKISMEAEEHATHVSSSCYFYESNISELCPCFERPVSSFFYDLNFIFILTHVFYFPKIQIS